MCSNMKRNIYRVLSNDTESYKVKQLSFEGNTTIAFGFEVRLKKFVTLINGLTDKGICSPS